MISHVQAAGMLPPYPSHDRHGDLKRVKGKRQLSVPTGGLVQASFAESEHITVEWAFPIETGRTNTKPRYVAGVLFAQVAY